MVTARINVKIFYTLLFAARLRFQFRYFEFENLLNLMLEKERERERERGERKKERVDRSFTTSVARDSVPK